MEKRRIELAKKFYDMFLEDNSKDEYVTLIEKKPPERLLKILFALEKKYGRDFAYQTVHECFGAIVSDINLEPPYFLSEILEFLEDNFVFLLEKQVTGSIFEFISIKIMSAKREIMGTVREFLAEEESKIMQLGR